MRLVFICLAGLNLVSLIACGTSSVAGDSGAGGATGGTPAMGGASSGGASSGSGGTMSIPWDQWKACAVDEDCVVVPQNTCCGCVPVGVNEEYEDEALTEFGKFNASSCPPGLGCPSFPCAPDPVPICEAGACGSREGCSARSEESCTMDGECVPYRARPCGSPTEQYVTCSRPTTCVGVPGCALSPYAQQFMFPDGCLPEGWMPCVSACE